MELSCAARVADIGSHKPSVLVLPERTELAELQRAQALTAESVVVAASAEGDLMRGHLLHRGINQVNYLKMLSDDVSRGTGVLPATPIYETPEFAIGMLICRDLQNPELQANVMNSLRASRSQLKVLCIPAHMGSGWFPSSRINDFLGGFLALSNHPGTPGDARCPSFIANPDGVRREVQNHHEPIYAYVP